MFLNDQDYKLIMSKKGMSTGLRVAVTAIVILIVALVVLTIFGGIPIGTLVDAKNNCLNQGQISCSAAGSLPITWSSYFKVGEQTTSCRDLVTVPGATDANPCGSWKP